MADTPATNEAAAPSTLYPKITNHISEIVATLQHKYPGTDTSSPIPIVGTVKLHGTHADILVHGDDSVTLQSRNRTHLVATPTGDNLEFAARMRTKRGAILKLRDRYVERWTALHGGRAPDKRIPVTIAGEWIGEKIQKGVAIAALSKRLVIISVKIDGAWVADSEYADIEAPDQGIYHVSRGGIYDRTLYPEDVQRTADELEVLAEKVAARCPFAEAFGVVGEGEGLVWKLVPHVDDAELWFKTKGGKFRPTFALAPKKPAEGIEEKRALAGQLARTWCGEMRLEQGWEYLQEQGIERNMMGIGAFLKWVQKDILVEEKGFIGANAVDEGLLRTEIIKVAKPWYLARHAAGGT